MAFRGGILGAGVHVRQSVIPAFLGRGWTVGALCSIDPDLPEQAAQFGIPVATTDYRALIERDDLDAVAIATPTPTHREILLAAVAAGKHVLCEKPIGMNLLEARETQAAAEASGVTAMIDFEFRFSPTRLHVQQLLADGYVGDVRHANIELMTQSPVVGPDLTLSWHDQAAMGGGTLNEHGSHYIDMVRQWFGEVIDVSARLHTFVPDRRDPMTGETVRSDADDFWTCTMTLADGGIVNQTQSWVSGITHGLRIAIAGTDGALIVTQNETMLSDVPVLGGTTGAAQLEELPRPASLPPLEDAPTWRIAVVQRLVREFEHGILEGESPTPNLWDGVRCQAVLDAVRESDRDGRRVSVSSV
jgi:predicted dehydrogenase